MFWLKASTTQVVAVGPMLDITDGSTPEDSLTVTSIKGEMHKYTADGAAPGLTTFTPTSTATYTIAGAMAPIASASGMYTLVLTPTMTSWRGSGKLVLRSSGTMLPYWENVFCATTSTVDAFVGTSYFGSDVRQIYGTSPTATTAHFGVNTVQIQGTAVTATAAMIGVNLVNVSGVAVTATSGMIGVRVVGSVDVGSMQNDVIQVNTYDVGASPADALLAYPVATAGGAMTLTSAAVDAILDDPMEGAQTVRQALRIMYAALAGKASGGGTLSINFRDLADAKNRIVATVDANGNRTAVAVDGT